MLLKSARFRGRLHHSLFVGALHAEQISAATLIGFKHEGWRVTAVEHAQRGGAAKTAVEVEMRPVDDLIAGREVLGKSKILTLPGEGLKNALAQEGIVWEGKALEVANR